MSAKGDLIHYRSITGVLYPAKFDRFIGPKAAIEVDVGSKDPVCLTVAWRERDEGERHAAWPQSPAA